MLKISTEFRKGVLFVRLVGRIDNEGYLEGINQVIDSMGIRYIVFNLSNLKGISLDSVQHIIEYNKEILEKRKLLFICDTNSIRNRLFKNRIPNIQSEIEAFSLI